MSAHYAHILLEVFVKSLYDVNNLKYTYAACIIVHLLLGLAALKWTTDNIFQQRRDRNWEAY